MADEKILTIVKGEEFKFSVKDTINETDIFYDQYIKAARMLDDIVSGNTNTVSSKWYGTESENNIIAFCGDRGEGKSSAMMTFTNAVYSYDRSDKNTIFASCENVKNTYFVEPIIIDPSMFDKVHNVLEIVIVTLYKNFRNQYDSNNQHFGVDEREKLLDQFQKVYRAVSLINNQVKMLDDEYDYEGNIGKLSKLGESTSLRNKLKELIKCYLKLMPGSSKADENRGNLLIAIDDLDLCSSNAYKMAEQIRKYLIIPNVVIVMAINVEQLKVCVQEKNFRSYKHVMKVEAHGFGEINSMAERYVAKLIPKARRIYLPNVQTMLNVKILYRDRAERKIYEGKIGDTINETLLDLIYSKTGMKFLPDKSGESFLLPDNLRDTVNFIILLGDMTDPKGDDSNYYDNIQKFCDFYEKEWLTANFDLEDCTEIQKLIRKDYMKLHENSEFLLRKCYDMSVKGFNPPLADFMSETNNSFFRVMNWLELFRTSVLGYKEEKYVYAFYILYSIRLNELLKLRKYNELAKFIGGYVWAGNFTNVLPNTQGKQFNRSRFWLPTKDVFNIISEEFYPGKNISLQNSTVSEDYVSKISENDENKLEKQWIWLLVGMLSNTYFTAQNQIIYTFNTQTIINSNYRLLQNVCISLENYMVSLCNLRSLYEKVNMEPLGISKQEFDRFIDKLEDYNKDIITVFRNIVTNTDLAMDFKEYCSNKKNSHEEGEKDEEGRTKAVVERFFKNVRKFAEKYLGVGSQMDFDIFVMGYDNNGNRTSVKISNLYGLLVQAAIRNLDMMEMNAISNKSKEQVYIFASKLRDRTNIDISIKKVSSFLKNKSAQNAKLNMDNLANNIQQYYSKMGWAQLPESEMTRLCDYYEKIIDIYIKDPTKNIPDILAEEYKDIVSYYQKTCV